MALVKVNCSRCIGTGLIGAANITVCPDCKGTGTLTVDDSSTLNTLNAAAVTPFEENSSEIPVENIEEIETDGI